MTLICRTKETLIAMMLISLSAIPVLSFALSKNDIKPVVTSQVLEKARKNNNWKFAFITGKDAQVVFMSITPSTNPNNEIGMETHKFDQIIFVAEGNGQAILNDKKSKVASGDMIFIPQGTPHNVINLNAKKPLKILSVYSDTDIPSNASYKTISDEPKE